MIDTPNLLLADVLAVLLDDHRIRVSRRNLERLAGELPDYLAAHQLAIVTAKPIEGNATDVR
jgi:hypothetical protein